MNASLPTTTRNWLNNAKQTLLRSDIATADLDALVLLEDCLKTPRANILAHPEQELTSDQLTTLNAQLSRRKDHEPLAYIREKTEFYGRQFIVNRYTLEPRPETETMIELLKKLTLSSDSIIVDIGTGSGAIAITTQLELPNTKVIATDISQKCLATTQENIKIHNLTIPLIQGNLLTPLVDQKIDVVLCNLPYVPDKYSVNKAALHEPKIALYGGKDGLDLYRELFEQVRARAQKPSFILCESLPFQHEQLNTIAQSTGYKLYNSDGFIQIFTTS